MHARVCMHVAAERQKKRPAPRVMRGAGLSCAGASRRSLGHPLGGRGDQDRRARGRLDYRHGRALAPRACHVLGESTGNRALADDEHKRLVRHGDDSATVPLGIRNARAHVTVKRESRAPGESRAGLQHTPLGGRVFVGGRAVAVVAVVHCVAFRVSGHTV